VHAVSLGSCGNQNKKMSKRRRRVDEGCSGYCSWTWSKVVGSVLSLTQCDLLDNSDDVGIVVRFPRSRRDWLEPLFFPSFPGSSRRVTVGSQDGRIVVVPGSELREGLDRLCRDRSASADGDIIPDCQWWLFGTELVSLECRLYEREFQIFRRHSTSPMAFMRPP
jgi:hypothetical protein